MSEVPKCKTHTETELVWGQCWLCEVAREIEEHDKVLRAIKADRRKGRTPR